jgi:hypothetical protein
METSPFPREDITAMPPLPPFLTAGEDDARFYALAYCRGAYGSHGPRTEPVFLVLYFCTSPAFTRYSQHIVDDEGRRFAYFRGNDERDTADYALLWAWDDHQVAPATWRLFPLANIPGDAWEGRPGEHAAYMAARADLCRLLYAFRISAHFAAPPLFHPDPDFVPPSLLAGESSEESREILGAVMESVRDSPAYEGAGDED